MDSGKTSGEKAINIPESNSGKHKAAVTATTKAVVLHPQAKWKRGIAIFDFILRICALVAALAATATMGTTDQTLPFFTQFFQFQASYDDLPTFTFFVLAVGNSGGSPSHLNSSLTEWLDCTASSSPWFVSSQPHEVATPCRSSSSLMLLHSSCPVAVVTGDAAAARRRHSSDSWSFFVHAATPLSLAQVIQQQQPRLVFTRNTPPRTTNGRPRLATAPATPSATWGNDSGQVQFH